MLGVATGRSRLLMSLAPSAKKRGCYMKLPKGGKSHRKETEKLQEPENKERFPTHVGVWPCGDLSLQEEVASG